MNARLIVDLVKLRRTCLWLVRRKSSGGQREARRGCWCCGSGNEAEKRKEKVLGCCTLGRGAGGGKGVVTLSTKRRSDGNR